MILSRDAEKKGCRARADNLKNLGMPGGGAADACKENVQMRWNDHNDLYD